MFIVNLMFVTRYKYFFYTQIYTSSMKLSLHTREIKTNEILFEYITIACFVDPN